MNVTILIDDIRIKSNLTNNETLMFTKRCFFYTILGFIQLHSGVLGDIEGSVQLIPDRYKNERLINIKRIDNIHLCWDCIIVRFVYGVRQSALYNFALDKPSEHKIDNELKIKLFKKVSKSVLSHITFYLEDDDHKPVDFNNALVSFTCQLIEL